MDKNELAEKIVRDITSFLGLSRFLSSKVKDIVLDNLESAQLPPFNPVNPSGSEMGLDGLSDSTPQG